MQPEVVGQAQRGDSDALSAVVSGCADRLYTIAFRILRDADLANDALQQALIEVWRDLPTLRDPARFDSWSCRLVVRASYREARRERGLVAKVRRIPVVDGSGADGERDVDTRDELERGFRLLTPEHRAVLVLRYFVGLSEAEIAETLGVPVGTVGSRLHYAARQLRAALEADARSAAAWRQPA